MAIRTKFTKGYYYPENECGNCTAGINVEVVAHPEGGVGEWHNRIEIYGATMEDATQLRDRVLNLLVEDEVIEESWRRS